MFLHDMKNDIQQIADPEKGKFLQRFFKTGKGEYAEGDVFLGLTVPQSRVIARKYKDLPLAECVKLLQSRLHEERLIALFILVLQFTKGDVVKKKELYNLYLSHTAYINNWDLVDSSADKIVGEYLFQTNASTDILVQLAHSESLWERRIAIIATFAFIKHGSADETLMIAPLLLTDKHDLIHKAVGWMLREMGKKVSLEKEEEFLKKYCKVMPRTMLRYAIELFPQEKRLKYLNGGI